MIMNPDPSDRLTNIFTVGGTVDSQKRLYIKREADNTLLTLCLAGKFGFVLNTRQVGKSSLKVATARSLQQEGIAVVDIDLTSIGTTVNAEQWYWGIISDIARQLGMNIPELRSWWREHSDLGCVKCFSLFFTDYVLKAQKSQIVVFIDEIDTTRKLSFGDDFFAAIRDFYNSRATNPELNRLSFVLLGSATPNDLISDPTRTPFNIGEGIVLEDFTFKEAQAFKQGLPERYGDTLIERIFYWTQGHPFLTQKLCAEISERYALIVQPVESFVDELVNVLFLSKQEVVDVNLDFVSNMLIKFVPAGMELETVLGTYQDILVKPGIQDEEQSLVYTFLKLSGVVKTVEGSLSVRNRIYQQVFSESWIFKNMPSEDILWKKRIEGMARAYEREEGELLTGERIELAHDLVRKNPNFFDERTLGYIEKSTRTWTSLKRSELRGRWLLPSMILLGILLLASGFVSWQWWKAFTETHEAQRQQEVTFAQGVYYQALIPAINPNSTNGQADLAALLARQSAHYLNDAEQETEGYSNVMNVLQALPPTLETFLHGHQTFITSVTFSPDGKLLASADGDATILLWDVSTHQRLPEPLIGHHDSVRSLAFSPDGKILASGSSDGTILFWDVVSRKTVAEPLQGHQGNVSSLAFSPDGTLLASGSGDSTVILWDIGRQKILGEPLKGHSDSVRSVAFNSDGTLLASGSDDKTIILWDIGNQKSLQSLKGHLDSVNSLAFSPGKSFLASAGGDSRILLWDVESRSSIGQVLKGHRKVVHSVAFSPDHKILASAGDDNTILLWDIEKRTLLEALLGHTKPISSIAFSPDGKTLVSTAGDGEMMLWNTSSRKPESEALQGHTGNLYALAFSQDIFATAGVDTTIMLWDLASQKRVGEPWQGHRGSIYALAFSPDHKILASAGDDNTILLWDVEKRTLLKSLQGHVDSVRSLAFSPDGKILVSSSRDKTIRLWDMSTQAAMGEVLQGHSSNVTSLVFSPDGKILASASWDKTIILWDVSSWKMLGEPLKGHRDSVNSLAFSSDGKTLASGSGDSTVMLWRMGDDLLDRACDLANRNLTVAEWKKFLGDRPYESTCPEFPPAVSESTQDQ